MGKYDDIIHMEHPTSSRHPRMSLHDRAAQFSPFAALTGHAEAIRETARLTEGDVRLTEEEIARLDEKLQILETYAGTGEPFSCSYFRPDRRKEGGAFLTCTGPVKKLNRYAGRLVMEDGTEIPVDAIRALSGRPLQEL